MPSANRNRPAKQRRQTVNNGEIGVAATTQPSAVPVYTAHEPSSGIERIGDILRRRRQQRGDDLQQIADYLCIRRGFLVAIENSAYDELPADAYVIGFLRSYAAYLGFDGGDAINRYRGEMSGQRRKPTLILPTPIVEGRTPSTVIMVGAVVVAVLIYVLWYGLSTSNRSDAAMQPPLPPTSVAASAATNNAVPAPIPGGIALSSPPPNEPISATASVANGQAALAPPNAAPLTPQAQSLTIPADTVTNTRLAIRAEKESWVVVADGKGHAVLDRVLKPGDTFAVPDMEGLRLTTGNSGGIVLVLDGKDLPKLSRDSSILHDIPLDIDKLKTGKTKPAAHE